MPEHTQPNIQPQHHRTDLHLRTNPTNRLGNHIHPHKDGTRNNRTRQKRSQPHAQSESAQKLSQTNNRRRQKSAKPERHNPKNITHKKRG
jgi:hypothetical protein